jgi:Flp pilus assembly pilin Flp
MIVLTAGFMVKATMRNSVGAGLGKLLVWMRRVTRRDGQTLVEYALILAIISVVAVGAMISLGQGVKGVYSAITSDVAVAASSH